MKTYIVNNAFFNKNSKVEMNEQEYNKWLQVNAAAHYNMFRVVGDEASGHFYIDFEEMWEVTVIDK